MRVIITESKRSKIAIKWLEDDYPNLELLRYPEYEDIFVADKGMFKMSYISRTKTLHVKNDIWDFIRNMFGFDNDEVSDLLLEWANKKFGFRGKKCYRVEQV
jgi:hypothetical protein